MNRKRLRKLEAAVAKRGGQFWTNPNTPPEITVAFLAQLLECPDCRPAVLEAFDDVDEGSVDAKIRALMTRAEH